MLEPAVSVTLKLTRWLQTSLNWSLFVSSFLHPQLDLGENLVSIIPPRRWPLLLGSG